MMHGHACGLREAAGGRGAVAHLGKILQHKPGLKKWGEAVWSGGAKGGTGKLEGGEGWWAGDSWGVSDEERGWREERRGGGRVLPVAIPASPHRHAERKKENIRPHDILSGSLAFPPCRVMCLLPPFPFPPLSPSLLLPFKASTCHLPPQKQRWEDSLALPLPQGVWH